MFHLLSVGTIILLWSSVYEEAGGLKSSVLRWLRRITRGERGRERERGSKKVFSSSS